MTFITKASGEHEEFSEEKILSSMQRAGIPSKLHSQVLSHVKTKLYEDIPSSTIYHHVLESLDTSHPFSKSKYTLKESIMQLGPTGYPFEKFLAKLLEREGYTTLTNQLIPGTCVTHEIDIVAQKDNVKTMVEAKFHHATGIKTDLHVSLYTKARFDDVAHKNLFNKAMLITNTKASIDAIAYAECVHMDIITWEYPHGRGLRDLIEKHHLHPLTTLHTLSQSQKQQLLENNIVLCKDVVDPDNLSQLHLTSEKMKEVAEEASYACSLPR